jgi:hypothetical protein
MDVRVIPDLTGSAEIVLSRERNTMVVPAPAVFAEKTSLRLRAGTRRLDQEEGGSGTAQLHHVAIKSGIQKGDIVALQRPDVCGANTDK